MYRFIIIMLMFVFGHTQAAEYEHLSARQRHIATMAYEIGERYDLEKTMVAIAYTESSFGIAEKVGDKRHPVGQRSYGVMQVKAATAKVALRRNPELRFDHEYDYEIVERLIHDPVWNMKVAREILLWLRKDLELDWREMVIAYNEGDGAYHRYDPETHDYAQKVIHSVGEGFASRFHPERIAYQ